MKVWPFLISGNPHLENRPVVVPDFVKEAGAEREIIRAAGGFNTTTGEAIYFKGYRQGLGVIDMVFRVMHARGNMVGQGNDDIMTDKQGRPIRVIAGIAFTERMPEVTFTQSQLDAAFAEIGTHFPRYWDEKTNWDAVVSRGFELPAAVGNPLRINVKESPTLPSSIPPSFPSEEPAMTLSPEDQDGEDPELKKKLHRRVRVKKPPKIREGKIRLWPFGRKD
ncbi:MAG TPA: hypothetical protein VNT99_19330 [Methylomirabilota bacterium]|nr:hypothetical protein [Methylomirabilota bacterium]